MNEVSHLATDKDIVTMVTAIIGAICLVIGGTIGFFTKCFYENKKINESKKALRQQMITNNIAPMRQAWINDLRKTMADFLSQCETLSLVFHLHKENRFSENEIDANKDKIIRIKNLMLTYRYLVLLLPANEDEVTAIKNLMTGVMNCIINNTDTYDEDLVSISIKTQELLKREWEVTKSLKEIE
ncbi:hypothetical protein ACS7D7_15450 [Proteus mirabilis]|uniref:hypothetical protein n=1 Tax=Proteus mirabilis TaxID=584 RepID=UPI00066655AE|nr:hypothetical protein [Proteus mirabilis]MBI6374205.1 hypothetical protein [Proteus mirabilis]HCT9654166.1 hypothetical protein [Proteus mirabilis]HEK1022526.1 hypothetical protein [Proteus mirabilis]